jgi:integrase
LNDEFRKARDVVGRPDVTFHDLRHAAGTFAAQQGATTKEIMTRIGHASPAASLRYQHASPGRDQELAAQMDRVLEPGTRRRRRGKSAGKGNERRSGPQEKSQVERKSG